MKITENYMEKVYAGWLGKIIGIRLGAPIEGWTYQRIRDVFGEVWSYPADYKNFAADDDSNGPLFFIRALEDCEDLNNFSSKDVANALLNYAPYEHGFFWWGGYGVSTEHTAYLNLRNGIPAPRSGSIEQNGATMAEQIGGQIFIAKRFCRFHHRICLRYFFIPPESEIGGIIARAPPVVKVYFSRKHGERKSSFWERLRLGQRTAHAATLPALAYIT